MIKLFGVEGFDEAHFIRDRLQVREEIANPKPILTTEFPILEGWRARVAALAAGHARHALRALDRGGQVLAGVVPQGLFRVEEVDVREALALEEAEDALRLRCEVRDAGEPAAGAWWLTAPTPQWRQAKVRALVAFLIS